MACISSLLAACQSAPIAPPSLQHVAPSYYQIFRIAPTKKRPEIIIMEREAKPADRAIEIKKKEVLDAIGGIQGDIANKLKDRTHE